ncbi:MAG: hypothetical protein GVY29_08590 [Spirochaetes bacterium]|jgi:hypothetical protein|nr:hypothetical protein [Spirochaetota bacterium]
MKWMGVVMVLCVLFFAGSLSAQQGTDAPQSYTIRNAVFLPQVFYVGDRVELRLRLRLEPGITLQQNSTPPRVQWGTVHGVTAVQQGQDAEVRVEFTAFRQGTLALPPLDLGRITIQGFDVFVETILSDNPELSPLRDQAILPSTDLLIAGSLAALVLAPLLWIFFARFGKKRVQRLVERYRANQPARRLNRALRQLDSEVQALKGREFYIALLEDLRAYVSQKLGVDCMSATTHELRGYLDQLIEDSQDREELVALFHYGDLVKFAQRRSPVKKRRKHIQDVQEVIAKIEHSQRKGKGTHVGVS